MRSILIFNGRVEVDGVSANVDPSGFPVGVDRIEFDKMSGRGRIVNADSTLVELGRSSFQPFERFVNRWKAASNPPERTLEQAKQDARNQINGRRDTLEASGFPYLGKTFDSDPRSVQRISTAVQAAQAALAAGQPFAITWTAQDNTTVDLDAAGMMGMPVALAQYAAGLHEHAKTKKAEIEAATTIAEADAVQW